MSAASSSQLAACAPAPAGPCTVGNCHWRCALDVIDELLGTGPVISGAEMDRLLDLRWQLRHRTDAEAALAIFCELRVAMEQRHYLAFFRIRRWLENHLVASVRASPAAEPQFVPVKLDRYCAIAVRRACLCAVLGRGSVMLTPRVAFEFRAVHSPAPTATRATVGELLTAP